LRRGVEWPPIINDDPVNASELLLMDQKIQFSSIFPEKFIGFFDSNIAIQLQIHLTKREMPG